MEAEDQSRTDTEDWSPVREAQEARLEMEVGITSKVSLLGTIQSLFLRNYRNQNFCQRPEPSQLGPIGDITDSNLSSLWLKE